MLLTTADVVGRYFFNTPIRGVFDLTHFAVLIMTFFGFAYCAHHGHHVVIEIIYDRLGPASRNRVKRAANAIGCVMFAAIGWQAIVAVADIKAFKFSSQLMLIPFWPFYYVLAAGSLLFAVVLALQVSSRSPGCSR
jgi:TRAP-type C4-dicarboxylate transport system permease small subunit